MRAIQDAKPLLDRYLNGDDYAAISKQVSAGYAACVSATHDHPVLGQFLPAILLRSWLITPFVDFGLTKMEGFTYMFKPNAAQNWFQTTLYKSGVAFTSHFLGGGKKHRRTVARHAVVRAELNKRNFDLFEIESVKPDVAPDFLYCHILHGGYNAPDSIVLAIPDRDQEDYFASMALDLVQPEAVQVEEIREEVIVKLVKQIEEDDEENAG